MGHLSDTGPDLSLPTLSLNAVRPPTSRSFRTGTLFLRRSMYGSRLLREGRLVQVRHYTFLRLHTDCLFVGEDESPRPHSNPTPRTETVKGRPWNPVLLSGETRRQRDDVLLLLPIWIKSQVLLLCDTFYGTFHDHLVCENFTRKGRSSGFRSFDSLSCLGRKVGLPCTRVRTLDAIEDTD